MPEHPHTVRPDVSGQPRADGYTPVPAMREERIPGRVTGTNLYQCPTCSAPVARDATTAHTTWHEYAVRLTVEAMRLHVENSPHLYADGSS